VGEVGYSPPPPPPYTRTAPALEPSECLCDPCDTGPHLHSQLLLAQLLTRCIFALQHIPTHRLKRIIVVTSIHR